MDALSIAGVVLALVAVLVLVDHLRRIAARRGAVAPSSAEEAARRTRSVVDAARAESARLREAREAQVDAALAAGATQADLDALAAMIDGDPDLD